MSVWIPCKEVRDKYQMFPDGAQNDNNAKLGMLVLTDSANAFLAAHASNPRSSDRLARLHLCYLRDGLGMYNLSPIAAGFKISDAGAKRKGDVHLSTLIKEPNT